jgi:hypothetical protein
MREQTITDIVQQVENELDDTLSMHAPLHWQDVELDAIAAEAVAHTRLVLEALSATELQSPGALDRHIAQAVAETKRLIHERI